MHRPSDADRSVADRHRRNRDRRPDPGEPNFNDVVALVATTVLALTFALKDYVSCLSAGIVTIRGKARLRTMGVTFAEAGKA